MSLESDIRSLVQSMDLELYETVVVNENDQTIYRVSVVSKEIKDSKRVGVSLDTCVELTHMISPLLDVTPPVSGDYRLEVGSPGIERKLSSLEHFTLSIGENISIQTVEKEKIKGLLSKVESNTVFIDTEDETLAINYKDITKAKTYFDL